MPLGCADTADSVEVCLDIGDVKTCSAAAWLPLSIEGGAKPLVCADTADSVEVCLDIGDLNTCSAAAWLPLSIEGGAKPLVCADTADSVEVCLDIGDLNTSGTPRLLPAGLGGPSCTLSGSAIAGRVASFDGRRERLSAAFRRSPEKWCKASANIRLAAAAKLSFFSR